MIPDLPVSGQLADLFSEGVEGRALPEDLPPGRIVRADEGQGRPALWMSDGPASAETWAGAFAERAGSGLWPLLLEGLHGAADFRPWESGELDHERSTPADAHDPASLLAEWWEWCVEDYEEDMRSEAERAEATAPFGERWPGLAPSSGNVADPDGMARGYAAYLLSGRRPLRLGLVAADRGADALVAAGWTGPVNHANDTGEIAAVVRSWEDRFGARVVGLGFADLYLSVAAPPQTLAAALHVAAEHFAFCPDNVWQGSRPYTLSGYAESLVGCNSWQFWWD